MDSSFVFIIVLFIIDHNISYVTLLYSIVYKVYTFTIWRPPHLNNKYVDVLTNNLILIITFTTYSIVH